MALLLEVLHRDPEDILKKFLHSGRDAEASQKQFLHSAQASKQASKQGKTLLTLSKFYPAPFYCEELLRSKKVRGLAQVSIKISGFFIFRE
jgi:hypothetical protein